MDTKKPNNITANTLEPAQAVTTRDDGAKARADSVTDLMEKSGITGLSNEHDETNPPSTEEAKTCLHALGGLVAGADKRSLDGIKQEAQNLLKKAGQERPEKRGKPAQAKLEGYVPDDSNAGPPPSTKLSEKSQQRKDQNELTPENPTPNKDGYRTSGQSPPSGKGKKRRRRRAGKKGGEQKGGRQESKQRSGDSGDRKSDSEQNSSVEPPGSTSESERPKPALFFLGLIENGGHVFHTHAKEAYASVPVDGHHENYPVLSRETRLFLIEGYYRTHGNAPDDFILNGALPTIEAKALFDGPEEKVHLRVAESQGNTYLDLGNDNFEAVEINADGWQVLKHPPVRFLRPSGMMALPRPERGGNIEELQSVLNVGEDDFQLLVAWLIGALRPNGPYPILILSGRQGSAKTTSARFLRSLVDPNRAIARALPRSERDLAISAQSNWVITLDNVSSLAPWLSDALCRISTEGAFSTRKLYTDDTEMVLVVSNPLLINGIANVGTRADLLDRAILIELPKISGSQRKDPEELESDFERIRPRVLALLLDAVSTGLRDVAKTDIGEAPRMAGFARFVAAAVPALGLHPEDFLQAYAVNRSDAVEIALGAHPLGAAI